MKVDTSRIMNSQLLKKVCLVAVLLQATALTLFSTELRAGWSFYRPAGEMDISEIITLEESEWTALSALEQFQTARVGSLLWYRLRLPQTVYRDAVLKTSYVDQCFRLFLEDTEIYRYGKRTDYLSSFSRHFISLPLDYPGKTLYFEVYSAIEMIGLGGGKVDFAPHSTLITGIIRQDLDKTVLAIMYCAIALFSLVFYFKRRVETTFLSFAVLVFNLGVYTFTRTDIKQVLFGNNYLLWGYLETSSLFLLPLGIDLFVRDILQPSKRNPMYWLWVLAAVYAIPVILISFFYPNVLQLVLPFFKIGLLANIILCLVFCFNAAFRKNGEAIIFILGFAVSAVCGFYDILQEMHVLPRGYFVTSWGILSLIVSLVIIIGNRILQVYSNLQDYTHEVEKKNLLVMETHKEMENLYNEIESTQKEVILRLSEVAEARSKETGNHVRRVTEYSRILAECYGLSQKELDILRLAAPMHDIGKLGIPDSILLKPGQLTPDEFTVIKSHTQVGYEMLRRSQREIFVSAAMIAHEHHEKFDGTGYPRSLKGDEIHIFGRITAVADVFDSLASDRCYKKAWPLEEVLAHMLKEANSHFDPQIIDVFFKHLDPILKIRADFQDEFVLST